MDEQRLRALASAASIGPWSVHGNNCDEWYVYALHARYETLPGNPSPVKVAWVPWSPGTLRHEHDAAYIAAVSPDVVLRLLDALDAARRQLRVAEARASEAYKTTIREIDDEWFREHDALKAERDAAIALLSECREFIDTTRDPAYPAGADLADRIDALLGGDKGA